MDSIAADVGCCRGASGGAAEDGIFKEAEAKVITGEVASSGTSARRRVGGVLGRAPGEHSSGLEVVTRSEHRRIEPQARADCPAPALAGMTIALEDASSTSPWH